MPGDFWRVQEAYLQALIYFNYCDSDLRYCTNRTLFEPSEVQAKDKEVGHLCRQ